MSWLRADNRHRTIASIDAASTPAMTKVGGLALMVCWVVLIKPERIDGPILECGDESPLFFPPPSIGARARQTYSTLRPGVHSLLLSPPCRPLKFQSEIVRSRAQPNNCT